MKMLRTFGLVFAVLLIGHSAGAAWEADTGDKIQVKAARAIANFRERLPRTEQYFEQAYGYAILPSVTRAGIQSAPPARSPRMSDKPNIPERCTTVTPA